VCGKFCGCVCVDWLGGVHALGKLGKTSEMPSESFACSECLDAACQHPTRPRRVRCPWAVEIATTTFPMQVRNCIVVSQDLGLAVSSALTVPGAFGTLFAETVATASAPHSTRSADGMNRPLEVVFSRRFHQPLPCLRVNHVVARVDFPPTAQSPHRLHWDLCNGSPL
jgi:hypothetical protein